MKYLSEKKLKNRTVTISILDVGARVMKQLLPLFWFGFWLEAQWLRERFGKKYPPPPPPIDIALLVSLRYAWHDYKLSHMIKIRPKKLMIISLFRLRQHFSVIPFPAILTSFLDCWKNLGKLFDWKILQLSSFESCRFKTSAKCLSQIKKSY